MHTADEAEPVPTSGSSRPTPVPWLYNPLITDPSFETTPPPGRPKDEFGIGISPDCEGLSPLQLGQMLVVYHPFAERHPEIVDTAELIQSWKSSIPPVRAQFFTFQISTFDKSRFPRTLIIAWKSHHSPYPRCTSTPLRLTHQDEHGQEHRTYST